MAAQPLPLTLEHFHRQYDGVKPAYDYWYCSAIVQAIIMLFLEKAGWNTA